MAGYTYRVLIAIGLIAIALFLWTVHKALLLGFAGLLVAVLIRGLGTTLSERTSLSTSWALAAVVAALVAGTVGFWWWLGPYIVSQVGQLAERLPDSYQALLTYVQDQSGLGMLVDALPSSRQALMQQFSLSSVRNVASTTLDAVLAAVLVLFIAVFFIISPGLYQRGVVHLVPKPHRDTAWEVLDNLGTSLWLWLLGRIVAIVFVAIAVTSGLWLLGVPLHFALGFIAGLLDFVPFVGPVAAAVPGVLLAFTQSPMTAVYTALLYFAVQQIEGNMITPLIQKRAVSLPPVLTLVSLTAFGLLFGLLGIILATPLLVVVLVTVKVLYVQNALDDEEVSVPGQSETQEAQPA